MAATRRDSVPLAAARPPPAWVPLLGGALGGTAGALFTCPLEVIKTRMQSSASTLRSKTVVGALKHVVRTEGFGSLWKGLIPNVGGVAPGRAVYFLTYTRMKQELASPTVLPDLRIGPDDAAMHLLAATSASLLTSTVMNPIWMVKTRLQLDTARRVPQFKYLRDGNSSKKVMARSPSLWRTTVECARSIGREEGVKGFWRGVTASYAGAIETSLQFVLYEQMRKRLMEHQKRRQMLQSDSVTLDATTTSGSSSNTTSGDPAMFFGYMGAAAVAKLVAATISYPHEVVRTRLRERSTTTSTRGAPYRGFFNTLLVVARTEGRAGLYGGLTPHLMRTVPNAAIVLCSFEVCTHFFRDY